MPEVPTYRNIPTPGFTRTPTAPADTQVQRALAQAGGAIANIGTKILGDFKKKQEISQYSTAQTDAIVAMNNLQAELLQNADYTKHEDLAIAAKDSIHTDAMRGITEPEAQAAFDRWFNKAYEQLEQSVVVNAIGAGKRKFAADLQSNLEKDSLMEYYQGLGQIKADISAARIGGVPAEILIELEDAAIHDLQLNDIRRIINIQTALAQDDYGAIETFINDAQETTKYAKLDANDWANVKRQAKSDFNFNKGLRKEALQKARNESFEVAVDEIMFKNTPNMTTKLYTEPRFEPLSGEDKLRLEGVMKAVATGSGEGGQPNFVNPEWHVKWLKMLADPRINLQEKEAEWERAVNEGLITGKTAIEQQWNNIAKYTSNQAAEDGMDIISDAFKDRKSKLEGKKSKRDELAELQAAEQEIYLMYTKDVYEHPEWTATQITNHANELKKPLQKRFMGNVLTALDETLNATIAGKPIELEEPIPVKPTEKPGGRVGAGEIPDQTTENANRKGFEKLTGEKLIYFGKNKNIFIGTDPNTLGIYESYKIGKKEWRWYNGGWQVYDKKKKAWVDAPEGPQGRGRQNR